jgi:hypothetical protein
MKVDTALLAAMLCVVPALAQAQGAVTDQQAARAPARLQELVLPDGSRLYGRVEQETADDFVFRTHAGAVLTVSRSEVVSLRTVEGAVVEGEFWRSDPNTSRLFFAPTGRAVPKGQVYLGMFQFLMPFVQVGVTDRFSVGGGTPLVFGFDDEWERPFWVTPKMQVFRSSSAQASAGLFHIFDTDGNGAGIAYAVGTFGGRDASLTVGAGVAYTGTDGGAGVLMLGGERQFRRNMKFVTENYVWNWSAGVASGGVRFFGERLSADLALAVPIAGDGFIVFPVVNFVYLF